jgi:tyrosyl-tRNA synthetase
MGGTDQLFNLLVGRHLMKEGGQEPQIVMTLPLLEGLDGVEKMSKSLGNYIAVEDPPNEMFGKLMSISDELMWRYWLLLTDSEADQIDELRAEVEAGRRHPMDVKKELAVNMVSEFHSPEQAQAAQLEFERVFSAKNLPQEIPELTCGVQESESLLSKVLAEVGLASSNSEARRIIKQGAVKVEGEPVRDIKATIKLSETRAVLVQVGKRRIGRIRIG